MKHNTYNPFASLSCVLKFDCIKLTGREKCLKLLHKSHPATNPIASYELTHSLAHSCASSSRDDHHVDLFAFWFTLCEIFGNIRCPRDKLLASIHNSSNVVVPRQRGAAVRPCYLDHILSRLPPHDRHPPSQAAALLWRTKTKLTSKAAATTITSPPPQLGSGQWSCHLKSAFFPSHHDSQEHPHKCDDKFVSGHEGQGLHPTTKRPISSEWTWYTFLIPQPPPFTLPINATQHFGTAFLENTTLCTHTLAKVYANW